jgi:hypothetical protein
MSAVITEWSSSYAHPAVTLRHSLGQAGEIEPETAALLEMEGIRNAQFSAEVGLARGPRASGWGLCVCVCVWWWGGGMGM